MLDRAAGAARAPTGSPADRLPVPPALAWMRDEALLRPIAIARVAGLTPEAYRRWTEGGWTPTAADVPLLAAFAQMHARLVARYPDPADRRAWWCDARRELGWISPAELLRRGRIGEVLLLVAKVDGPPA